jgi:hypothetical protein
VTIKIMRARCGESAEKFIRMERPHVNHAVCEVAVRLNPAGVTGCPAARLDRLCGPEPLAHDPPSGSITAEVLADEVEVHIDGRGRFQPAGIARGRRSGLGLAVRQSGAFMPYVSLSGALARMPWGGRRSLIDPGGLGQRRRVGCRGARGQ